MIKTVRYQLANTAGYKFNITKIGQTVYDELAYYHKENFPDLEITRPSTSSYLSLLHDNALISINGHVHPTVLINDRLYIPNATKSMLRSQKNSIGILSFNALEKNLIKTPLTSSMITAESLTPLYEKAIITLDHKITHPILVICGYLVFENPEFFYRVSPNSFALRLDRLSYVEKLYELNKYRNIFDDLEVPISENNPSVIDAETIRSNETIIKFLTSYNSFITEVPCQSLSLNKIYLEHSNLPGNFRTEIEPNLPMFVGYGKIAEYFKRKTNDVKYTVYINDNLYNNYLFSKLPTDQIKLYNDHREIGNTYSLSQAFFLQINIQE